MFGLHSRAVDHFLAVCETRNFTEAARRCGVTQPAVTKSIRKLEAAVGVPLFQRNPRGLALTQFGDLLKWHVGGMLNQVRYLEADIAALVDGRNGHIRIGVGHAIATTLFPGLVASMQKTFPGVDYEFETAVADELYPRLAEGAIDLMIASIHGIAPSPGLLIVPMSTIDMAVFAREGHPIWQTKFAPPDLLGYRWYVFAHDVVGVRALERYFGASWAHCPTLTFRSGALLTLMELARCSDGLAFLASNLAEEAAGRQLRPLPLTPPIWSFPLGVVVRAEAASVAPVRFILDYCRRHEGA